MNKRIVELALKSLPNVKYWNEELQKGSTPPKNYAITSTELEKFAELIVRKCAEIAETAEPYQSHDNILRHFGFD